MYYDFNEAIKHKFWTPRTVAVYFGVSKQTISRWVKQGKLPEPVRYRKQGTVFNGDDIQMIYYAYKGL